MAEKRSARAGDAGAVKAGKRFTRENNHPSAETQYRPCADECCYRLGRALRLGRLEPAERLEVVLDFVPGQPDVRCARLVGHGGWARRLRRARIGD